MIKWKLIALSSAFVLSGGAGPSKPPTQAPEPGPVPPRLIAGSISNLDYPPDAIRAREEGSVRMVISVGTDGSVTDCSVLVSSGSEVLDVQSCALARARFRFSPGRNAAGVAVPSQYLQSVRWSLPGLEPAGADAVMPFSSFEFRPSTEAADGGGSKLRPALSHGRHG